MPYLHLHLIIHVAFDPHVYVGVSVCVCVCQCVCVCVSVCVCVCVCGRNSSRRNALEENPFNYESIDSMRRSMLSPSHRTRLNPIVVNSSQLYRDLTRHHHRQEEKEEEQQRQ